MILFLTSSPCDDDVPAGCELPCIFFECNGFVENLRRHVREGMRFLAIAAWKDDHARNDEMAETFAGCFRWHGMGFSSAKVLDSRNQADAAELVAHSDVILLAGGHVPTQNAFFHEIGLRDLLADYPGDEDVFRFALEQFMTTKTKRGLYAGYLAKLDDDRALEHLLDVAEGDDVSYSDFIEIRSAIERLGSEAHVKDWTNDPTYKAFRRLQRM